MLRRVVISRFGRLSDLVLDELDAGAPLVIVGDNEAGKSTLREALLSLLGGFSPARARDHHYRPRSGGLLEVRAETGGGHELERSLERGARGRVVAGGSVRDLGNASWPREELERRRLAAVFFPTSDDLAASVAALARGIEPLLHGAAGDVEPAKVMAELRRRASAIWRPDRRGRPLVRGLESALRAARERREAAVEAQRRRRALADHEVALRDELAGIAASLSGARDALDLARTRRREQERRDRDLTRERRDAVRRGRRASALLAREAGLRSALGVLRDEAGDSARLAELLARSEAPQASALRASLYAADIDEVEARVRLRRGRRGLMRGMSGAAIAGAVLFGWIGVLPPVAAFAGAGFALFFRFWMEGGEDERLRADFRELVGPDLVWLDVGPDHRGGLAAWRGARDDLERGIESEARRAKARTVLTSLAERLRAEEGEGFVDGPLEAPRTWAAVLMRARRLEAAGADARRALEGDEDGARLGPNEVAEVAAIRRELASLDARRAECFERLGALREEAGRLAAEDGVDEIDGEIAWLENECERHLREHDRLVIAAALVEESERAFRAEVAPRLLARAGVRLKTLTEGRYDALAADEDGQLQVRDAAGAWHAAEAPLSRGTREQVGFAVRLALVEELDPEGELPLVLDETFVHWDQARRAAAWRLLARLARERVVIVTTCHGALAREARTLAQARVARLRGESAAREAAD